MNVYEYVLQRARAAPDSTAVHVQDGPHVSYDGLDETVRRVAAWLTERGVEPGDRVGVSLRDIPAYVPAVLGSLHVGAVPTPLNTRLGDQELAALLNDVRPRALVATADDPTTETLVDVTETLERDALLPVRGSGWLDVSALPTALDAQPATRLDDDPAFVMFTSGSTGRPKGVVQSHRNVTSQVHGGISMFGLDDGDVGLATVPLFHVGGFHEIVLMTLFAGGTVAVQDTWDALEWAALVEDAGATWSGLIPTMIVDVLDSPDALAQDTSSLRFCIYGGSATPEPVLQEFVAETGVNRMVDNYGLTESAGVCVTYRAEDDRRPGVMGTFAPEVEGTVVDLDSGDRVPKGAEGELLLRGDSITAGYWERPAANADLFSDGWLHTEDVVRETEDGYLVYVDRADDVLLSGGEKIAPSEVEDVIQEHPDVVAVSVLGTPHERYGEAVTAVVVPADDSLTADEVVAFTAEHPALADYKKPRRVYFVDAFPKTGSHKVDKTALEERLRDRYGDEWP
ncbi:class I adenylate-forming enzyme family protein [Halorubellus salinus]|uniref:class I adenylate-forming enzyme family protein n=1 Tax=Halorubellus salinus TaxID=755309 RepID=UPI001D0919EF|nr:AMP-binding protein [Halorubellus salinus]